MQEIILSCIINLLLQFLCKSFVFFVLQTNSCSVLQVTCIVLHSLASLVYMGMGILWNPQNYYDIINIFNAQEVSYINCNIYLRLTLTSLCPP